MTRKRKKITRAPGRGKPAGRREITSDRSWLRFSRDTLRFSREALRFFFSGK
ncbi:MAG: hypothetical protein LBK12_04270 [Odoribacteraceae bacterium]|jgi:hypothetical protein|nr:hypothetical protein [Odoribacteraceae bacterium]